jgi:UDPglucose--hexose-1-phosphate uridylyltransferase
LTLAELRKDWLTGRSVIVAENRALRPNEFVSAKLEPASRVAQNSPGRGVLASEPDASRFTTETCPFCPGNESGTPPAVYQQNNEDGRWRLRVVPNKFPALSLEFPNQQSTSESAFGAHEVIVESSRHIDRMSALSVNELQSVLEAYAARLRHWRDHEQLSYGLVFKNQGSRAGASLAHLHSQLLAMPTIPPAVDAELRRAKEAFARDVACPYCRMIESERTAASRLVFDRDGFIAFCPYASLQPHEVWLMPTAHSSSFEQSTSADELNRLASALHPLIARLESIVPAACYNMLVRTAPWRLDCDQWFHWRIELLPRANPIAGLEFATGTFINPVAPEHAAPQLRPS